VIYEPGSECFCDPFVIVSHVLGKVAGFFKTLDYDEIPRNENAFAILHLSEYELDLSRIVGRGVRTERIVSSIWRGTRSGTLTHSHGQSLRVVVYSSATRVTGARQTKWIERAQGLTWIASQFSIRGSLFTSSRGGGQPGTSLGGCATLYSFWKKPSCVSMKPTSPSCTSQGRYMGAPYCKAEKCFTYKLLSVGGM
jgi:hypothetical protein